MIAVFLRKEIILTVAIHLYNIPVRLIFKKFAAKRVKMFRFFYRPGNYFCDTARVMIVKDFSAKIKMPIRVICPFYFGTSIEVRKSINIVMTCFKKLAGQ